MSEATYNFFVCTVGGSPEPVVAALKHWTPHRVCFLPSPQTLPDIAGKILPLAEREGCGLDPGRYYLVELADAQSLASCVRTMRELTSEIEAWLARGDDFHVVLDFTGGTKCMSAALALQGHRWRCKFSYVGGLERTKDGVGIVVSGKEQVLHAQNPWDALGYQALEDSVLLFDQGAFDAASAVLKRALVNTTDTARKREIVGLQTLAEAYAAWDRFQHKDALGKLREAQKYENDMSAILGAPRAARLRSQLETHRERLGTLVDHRNPAEEKLLSPAHIADLLANARRCRDRGRFDDAVARLYRAIESIAQWRLWDKHGIADTKHVPAAVLPDKLKEEWSSRLDNGTVFLGLQDDYKLLAARGDALAGQFEKLGLHDREKSPLTNRNQSILAHGGQPVSPATYESLWRSSLLLSETSEQSLVRFPRLDSRAD